MERCQWIFLLINEELATKDNDTKVSLSKLKNPPKGRRFETSKEIWWIKSNVLGLESQFTLGRDVFVVLERVLNNEW